MMGGLTFQQGAVCHGFPYAHIPFHVPLYKMDFASPSRGDVRICFVDVFGILIYFWESAMKGLNGKFFLSEHTHN